MSSAIKSAHCECGTNSCNIKKKCKSIEPRVDAIPSETKLLKRKKQHFTVNYKAKQRSEYYLALPIVRYQQ